MKSLLYKRKLIKIFKYISLIFILSIIYQCKEESLGLAEEEEVISEDFKLYLSKNDGTSQKLLLKSLGNFEVEMNIYGFTGFNDFPQSISKMTLKEQNSDTTYVYNIEGNRIKSFSRVYDGKMENIIYYFNYDEPGKLKISAYLNKKVIRELIFESIIDFDNLNKTIQNKSLFAGAGPVDDFISNLDGLVRDDSVWKKAADLGYSISQFGKYVLALALRTGNRNAVKIGTIAFVAGQGLYYVSKIVPKIRDFVLDDLDYSDDPDDYDYSDSSDDFESKYEYIEDDFYDVVVNVTFRNSTTSACDSPTKDYYVDGELICTLASGESYTFQIKAGTYTVTVPNILNNDSFTRNFSEGSSVTIVCASGKSVIDKK